MSSSKPKDRGTYRGHLLLLLALLDAQQLPGARKLGLLLGVSQGAAVARVVKLLFHRAEQSKLALKKKDLHEEWQRAGSCAGKMDLWLAPWLDWVSLEAS